VRVRSNSSGHEPTARSVGALFSPLDVLLGLGTEGYSPSVLRKIEYAGANGASFAQASETLLALAEFSISSKHVQRISERLGAERRALQDQQVAQFKVDRLEPRYQDTPAVAVVQVDAGKLQLREASGTPGVRNPHWGDTKVACLVSYAAQELPIDPQPKPPAAFLDRAVVPRLCAEMERVRSHPVDSASMPRRTTDALERLEKVQKRRSPQPLLRTTVATMENSEDFGYRVATEARLRNFYQAPKRAIVGDGGNWITPLGDMHFPEWTQILDFLHLLVHLFAASGCAYGESSARAWTHYRKLLCWAWQGRVQAILRDLDRHQKRIGAPSAHAPDKDPRQILRRAIQYVRDNKARMDYPAYRRDGLPVTSALVESLIKQFNQRAKGTEKFWTMEGAEAILCSRAAYLSQDDRAARHFAGRPQGRAVGRRRLRRAA
jgi:hypothetical protein